MSSLLQYRGEITEQGVALQFVLVATVTKHLSETVSYPSPVDIDTFPCSICKRSHARIHIARRKPVDMLGCWVRFRYNGALHAPDLSVPIQVTKLPRDAKALTLDESAKIWHSE